MNKIIYMDAAASALKFKSGLDAQMDFIKNHYANHGRGVCANSVFVDNMVNNAREKIADFIGAKNDNIVFTSGTTAATNQIMRMVLNKIKKPNVAVSDLDHHSARLPWQISHDNNLCDLQVVDLDSDYNIVLDNISKIDVFVLTAMSNVLGKKQNIKELINRVKQINPNAVVIVDAAQYVVHSKIDVNDWDCDFLVFSVHKMGGDTGLGIMYVKDLDVWMPDNFGGGMVTNVLSNIDFAMGANKFEAGTLPLVQISGLSSVIDNMDKWKDVAILTKYIYDQLSEIKRIKFLTDENSCFITFVIDDMHYLDFGAFMSAYNICVRVGNCCASWAFNKMGYSGGVRISPGWWNSREDADSVINAIKAILK